jgi:hypothetical protein
MILSIINDSLAYNDLNLDLTLNIIIFLSSFLTLCLFNLYILLEVKAIREYIKKRGEK